MPEDELDDLPTIECLPEEGPVEAVVGGQRLYIPTQRADGSVTLPAVGHHESGNHYFGRIFAGESEELPEGVYGPPRPLSVKEVFEKGHCGAVNAQAALKYARRSRGR